MNRNLFHHWRIQRTLDRGAEQTESAGSEPGSDARYAAQVRTMERRLRREAALAGRTPSARLRARTLNAIYDLDFHRRYRRVAWWRTSQGGSSLVAASVLIAGVLFAVLTLRAQPDESSRDTRAARVDAPVTAHEIIAEAEALALAYEGPTSFDLHDDGMEITGIMSPEWVFRVVAPHSIREEWNAMADGARRAADYLVAHFTPGGERKPTTPELTLPAGVDR